VSEIDYTAVGSFLSGLGLGDWTPEIEPVVRKRLSVAGHGDFPGWRDAVEKLATAPDVPARRDLLRKLRPWRKGPFDVGGVHIDAEWRSDLKWNRLCDSIEPLGGRAVLDVGCGNGYYALRMQEAGARAVLGIDPTVLYVMQFLAVTIERRELPIVVLPLRLDELPDAPGAFDTTFSMGVLYHQRSPIDHLRQLRRTLRPGGQLVLETLFVPGEESYACTPEDRYARMRNVWLLPTVAELSTWLDRSGYRRIEIVDKSLTSTDEQRSTEWMTFESLSDALDPDDPERTVEGWPAPRRVVVTATAP
jgi:tRNA (mo5U34)-methyltransferase